MGMIFVFNLIVGTGALAIPKAFASAGWAISLTMIIIIAFLRFFEYYNFFNVYITLKYNTFENGFDSHFY